MGSATVSDEHSPSPDDSPLTIADILGLIEDGPEEPVVTLDDIAISQSSVDRVLRTLQQQVQTLLDRTQFLELPKDLDEPEERTPDEIYASLLSEYMGKAELTKTNGELIEVTTIGFLKNGEVAWVDHGRFMVGRVNRDLLEEIKPMPDDRFRARVVSHLWGQEVTAIDPHSLLSPYATRTARRIQVNVAGTVPEVIVGTEFATLRPGDVVLAHVAYSGTLPVDRRGRTGKARPSVFIEWENGYAVLRPVYDAHGYAAQNDLADRLIDSSVMKKASAVRRTEYDIDANLIYRKLGRLGKKDLEMLGISQTVESPTSDSGASVVDDSTSRRHSDPILSFAPEILRRLESTGIVQPAHLMAAILNVLASEEVSVAHLQYHGAEYAKLGQLLQEVADHIGVTLPNHAFKNAMPYVLSHPQMTPGAHFYAARDEHDLPILRIGNQHRPVSTDTLPEPQPINRDDNEPTFVSLELPDEAVEPDIILYDQEIMGLRLGDLRLDLSDALELLRQGTDAPAFMLAEVTGPASQNFQRAAVQRGWTAPTVSSRDDLIDVACGLCRTASAQYVTVVTDQADLVSALENNGFEVSIVNSFS